MKLTVESILESGVSQASIGITYQHELNHFADPNDYEAIWSKPNPGKYHPQAVARVASRSEVGAAIFESEMIEVRRRL